MKFCKYHNEKVFFHVNNVNKFDVEKVLALPSLSSGPGAKVRKSEEVLGPYTSLSPVCVDCASPLPDMVKIAILEKAELIHLIFFLFL